MRIIALNYNYYSSPNHTNHVFKHKKPKKNLSQYEKAEFITELIAVFFFFLIYAKLSDYHIFHQSAETYFQIQYCINFRFFFFLNLYVIFNTIFARNYLLRRNWY